MGNSKKLTRDQMRRITGGNISSCTADCGNKVTVTCGGAACTAVDGIGCTDGKNATLCPDE